MPWIWLVENCRLANIKVPTQMAENEDNAEDAQNEGRKDGYGGSARTTTRGTHGARARQSSASRQLDEDAEDYEGQRQRPARSRTSGRILIELGAGSSSGSADVTADWDGGNHYLFIVTGTAPGPRLQDLAHGVVEHAASMRPFLLRPPQPHQGHQPPRRHLERGRLVGHPGAQPWPPGGACTT